MEEDRFNSIEQIPTPDRAGALFFTAIFRDIVGEARARARANIVYCRLLLYRIPQQND